MTVKDMKKYQSEYYLARKESLQQRTRARRRLLMRVSQEIRNTTPCMDCGVQYPSYVMQFDHRPEEVKIRNVADYSQFSSIIKLLEEIAKCDVVCANCHAVRTFTRRLELTGPGSGVPRETIRDDDGAQVWKGPALDIAW